MNPSDKQRYYNSTERNKDASGVNLSPEEIDARIRARGPLITEGLLSAMQVAAVTDADTQVAFPAGAPDWTALKAHVSSLRTRKAVLVAEMPRHPPMRLMSSVAVGIHPPRDLFSMRNLKRNTPEEL